MSGGSRTVPGSRGWLRSWFGWFAFLNLIWLVLISAFVVAETILGVFAALVGATAAATASAEGLGGFRVRSRWLLSARVLPRRAMRESALVLSALVRRVAGRSRARGRFRLVPVSLPQDAHENAAKRALLTAGRSFAPNSYVIGIDVRRQVMLIHELVPEDTE
jgi:multisubunit Na+/H+ antiporter MnhE subunit